MLKLFLLQIVCFTLFSTSESSSKHCATLVWHQSNEGFTTRVNNLEERLDQQINTLREELIRRFEELVLLVRNNKESIARNQKQHRVQYVEEEDDIKEHNLYAQPKKGHANGEDMYKIKGAIPTLNEGAGAWWNHHQEELHLRGENRVRYWLQMKALLEARFLPADCKQILYLQFHNYVQELFKEVQDILEASNKKYKQLADKKKMLMSLQIGDQVMKILMLMMLGVEDDIDDMGVSFESKSGNYWYRALYG
ncbi:hypothetical protein BC332_01933 [Capsicum chinense]|nr:hypothetical protein BC332_01933 [Capsicum chinense]